MKRVVSFLAVAVMFFSVIGAAVAGGDKNCNKERGDEGQGETHQVDADSQDNQKP